MILASTNSAIRCEVGGERSTCGVYDAMDATAMFPPRLGVPFYQLKVSL